MNNITSAQTFASLKNSKLLKAYSAAFQGATGLDLRLEFDPPSDNAVPVMMRDTAVAYLQIIPIPNENAAATSRFQSALILVKTFAHQLGELVGRLLLEQQAAEPASIANAKRYIIANLDDPLKLDTVAAQVKVSPFYFCKLFKSTTGMTFTEFVNRQRVERAKRRLLDPAQRITEIAYEIGYQSLSQFNRSFHRIVGESPTQFRKRMGVGKVSRRLVA
ncbi:MAG: AraC-like DNA-binding protein [Verrucomicrobiales bacterium]|jgi:AraC-like DNA-binding protein